MSENKENVNTTSTTGAVPNIEYMGALGNCVEVKGIEKIYVVEALRWGIRENYSYIVSCYYDKDKAMESAKQEQRERGNKYKIVVNECNLNKHTPEDVKEIFTTMIN